MWHWSVMNWISVELFNTKKYQLKTLCNWWHVGSENVGGYYDQLVLMDIWFRFENKMQPIRKRYWHRSVTLFFLGCVVPSDKWVIMWQRCQQFCWVECQIVSFKKDKGNVPELMSHTVSTDSATDCTKVYIWQGLLLEVLGVVMQNH